MFAKLYLVLFAISLLVILTTTFLTYSQLQSVGFPAPKIIENFQSYDGLFKTILWISSVSLWILANVILWTSRKSWALWLTFLYFAVFISLDMWWLAGALVSFQKQNNLFDGSFQVGGIFSAFMIVIVAIGVFFNQFLVTRLSDKMFGSSARQPENPSEHAGSNNQI